MEIPKQTNDELTFRKMLERFYLNQAPPDPTDPESHPPVNLKDRKQG